ncbi:hypothetical protein COPCOM_03657 [Coprococcus comes ATCC 27758]|uniref:Uncharacterized protein n=1 Tax=Coprococcus comes ATCC 27758 TaxID=470146 RepID=C0BEP4_9FIRM|nr:hypothetical protein COPCOM_03657 [Coprococcus comes ATCC 27758]
MYDVSIKRINCVEMEQSDYIIGYRSFIYSCLKHIGKVVIFYY